MGSANDWIVGGVNISRLIALVGFLVALCIRAYLHATRPLAAWYDGRG